MACGQRGGATEPSAQASLRLGLDVNFAAIVAGIESWIVAVVLVGSLFVARIVTRIVAGIVVAVVDIGLFVVAVAIVARAGMGAPAQHVAKAVCHQDATCNTRGGCKG